VKLPLPPGTLPTLVGADDRYVASYLSAFPGYYLPPGDGGYLDDDGYLFVMGRHRRRHNVAGHRLSHRLDRAVLANHPAVAEMRGDRVADDMKGQVPRGSVVLKAGASADGLVDETGCGAVRQNIGAVASLKRVDVVAALPKARSGKILRKTMRGIRGRSRRRAAVDHRGRHGPRRAEARAAVLTASRSAARFPLSVIRTIVK